MEQKKDDAFVNEIDENVQKYNHSRDWRRRHMEWEQYRLELIEQGEERGEKRGIRIGKKQGEKKGIRKTLKRAVKTQFDCLMTLGLDQEQALRHIRKGYPEVSDKEIQKILSI